MRYDVGVKGWNLGSGVQWHHWTRWMGTAACSTSPSVNPQIHERQTNQQILMHKRGSIHQIEIHRHKQCKNQSHIYDIIRCYMCSGLFMICVALVFFLLEPKLSSVERGLWEPCLFTHRSCNDLN